MYLLSLLFSSHFLCGWLRSLAFVCVYGGCWLQENFFCWKSPCRIFFCHVWLKPNRNIFFSEDDDILVFFPGPSVHHGYHHHRDSHSIHIHGRREEKEDGGKKTKLFLGSFRYNFFATFFCFVEAKEKERKGDWSIFFLKKTIHGIQ